MISVGIPIPKPALFDANCRDPGNIWLAANPTATNYPNLWAQFEDDLANGFHFRCGWLAYEINEGDVDHYLSKKYHRPRIYEWENYRYISGAVNSSKRNLDDRVLDPFEIQNGWFVVGLPDLQVSRTDLVPEPLRSKAEFTITKLKLNRKKFRRTRERHYQRHKLGLMPLPLLKIMNPLLGDAVDRYVAAHPGLPLP